MGKVGSSNLSWSTTIMKHKNYIKLSKYRSALSTAKQKRSDAMFIWLKEMYCKSMGIPYRD